MTSTSDLPSVPTPVLPCGRETAPADAVQIHALFTILQSELDKLKAILPEFLTMPKPEAVEIVCDILSDFEDGVEAMFNVIENTVENSENFSAWKQAALDTLDGCDKEKVKTKIGRRGSKLASETSALKETKARVKTAEKERSILLKAGKARGEDDARKLAKPALKHSKAPVPVPSSRSAETTDDAVPKKRKRAGKKELPVLVVDSSGDIVSLP